MAIFQRLNDEGRTIIMVTHEDEVAEHAKRVIRLQDGEIILDEPIKNRSLSQQNISRNFAERENGRRVIPSYP